MPITREVRDPDRLAMTSSDLGCLTAAEKLFLWRHRQRSKNGQLLGQNGDRMSQEEAAELLGISWSAYNKLENGFRAYISADELEVFLHALEPIRPTVGELCLIARRRSGRFLSDVEREVGVSRPRYHKMERAGDAAIVSFWADRGFAFPLFTSSTI